MAQMDPEDGMDQVMISAWNSLAQQMRTLQNELRGDHARRVDQNARAETKLNAEKMQRSHQQTLLKEWEVNNRARLNSGYEATLKATVLAGDDRWRSMNDSSLLRTWMVAEQLEAGDPGFSPQIVEAKNRLKNEWGSRHPDQKIDAAADRLVNHITVTYAHTSPELQATLEAFTKAGVPFTQQSMGETEYAAKHGGHAFWVDSQLTESWGGYDHDRIVEAVMVAPVDGLEATASRIAFLKDQGLPETTPADNTAGGFEPSTVSETERSETGDNAPIITSEPEHGRDDTAADTNTEETGDPLPTHDAAIGSSASHVAKPASESAADAPSMAPPSSGGYARHAAPKVEGGGDLDSGETNGYEDMPIGLDEPEDWYGPDPFGEYSPAMEASLGNNDIPGNGQSMPTASPTETLTHIDTAANRR